MANNPSFTFTTPLDLNNQIQTVMTITMLFIYSQSTHAPSVNKNTDMNDLSYLLFTGSAIN